MSSDQDPVARGYVAVGMESRRPGRQGVAEGGADAPDQDADDQDADDQDADDQDVDDDTLSVEEKVGQAVLRLRLYWGWSQSSLERRSGVDQTTISRLERGLQHGLSIRRLFAILRALRVGDVTFAPPKPFVPPTLLELMLHGDPWERATRETERRRRRPRSA
jgi:transcriptional regulator with XRE-family HTH domain